MNRVCNFVIGTIFMVLPTFAQQTSSGPGAANFPSVDAQMRVLTEKLGLTTEQQSEIRPIMLELHDYTVRLIQDESLSQQERLDKVRPRRIAAGSKIREFLTDEQQAKLDLYLRGPHREMHGDLSGEATGAASPK